MTNLVSFHNIPMPRGLAFSINHIEEHGAKVAIFSADRTVAAIAEHNRQFGTHLHSQAYLINLAARGLGNPANPISQTSHCYFADGNPAYRTPTDKVIRPGGKLPWYMLGIDLSDWGKYEDVSRFRATARRLGYHVTQPYASGTEHHHIIFTKSPIANLERWHVISENRG